MLHAALAGGWLGSEEEEEEAEEAGNPVLLPTCSVTLGKLEFLTSVSPTEKRRQTPTSAS